jgi:hypothetical protein
MNGFAVVRMWRAGKRSFCIVVGTFPTRAIAQTYLRRACREFTIPRDQMHIATYRAAHQ